MHSFIVGTFDDGKLRVRRWAMPEMSPERFEKRNPFANPECLIAKEGTLNEELQTQNDRTGL
jgi:hypothetical protein